MTERSSDRWRSSWEWPLLSVALVIAAILATILCAATASAATTGGVETRVGAHNQTVEVLVEPPKHIRAGQRLGIGATGPETAVATGFAANEAVRTPQVIRAGDLKLAGVAKGASGVPVRSGKGLEYQIPRGTPELDPRVASIRVMDPVTTGKYQYPNGYVTYMNRGGQAVNPLTGRTLQPADTLWHIELP